MNLPRLLLFSLFAFILFSSDGFVDEELHEVDIASILLTGDGNVVSL